MRNYRNYQLKNSILKSLNNSSLTVKSIHGVIQYRGDKDELFSEMYSLFKKGYVKRHKNAQRLYEYSLTKKGIQHANNPFLRKITFNEKVNEQSKKEVDDILMKDEKFAHAVHRMANDLSQRPVVVNQPPQSPSIEDMHRPFMDGLNGLNNHHPKTVRLMGDYAEPLSERIKDRATIRELERKVKEYEWEKSILEDVAKKLSDELVKLEVKAQQKPAAHEQPAYVIPTSSKYIDPRTGNELSPERMYQINQKKQQNEKVKTLTMQRRKALFNRYNGYLLNIDFFNDWSGVFPYWIKHFGLFKPGSIEILSPSNDEIVVREHSKGKLTADDILKAQFIIQSYDNNGIWVVGIGMKKPSYMRF